MQHLYIATNLHSLILPDYFPANLLISLEGEQTPRLFYRLTPAVLVWGWLRCLETDDKNAAGYAAGDETARKTVELMTQRWTPILAWAKTNLDWPDVEREMTAAKAAVKKGMPLKLPESISTRLDVEVAALSFAQKYPLFERARSYRSRMLQQPEPTESDELDELNEEESEETIHANLT